MDLYSNLMGFEIHPTGFSFWKSYSCVNATFLFKKQIKFTKV
jgi:hypothetical protein